MPPRVFPYFNFLRLSSPAEIYCLYDLIWPSSQYLQFKMYSLKIYIAESKELEIIPKRKKKYHMLHEVHLVSFFTYGDIILSFSYPYLNS